MTTAARPVAETAMKMPSLMQALPYALGGVGLAALENKFIAGEAPPELQKVNLGIGGITGYLLTSPDPKVRFAALASVPTKQLGLFGIGAADKLRRQQQSLVDANLGIANINRGTAEQQQANAARAGRVALAFLLPALAAGGALGYMGYERWKKRKQTIPRYKTVGEKGRSRAGQKIRIDVPATALPPEFFSSLTDADDSPRAHTRLLQLANGAPEMGKAATECLVKLAMVDEERPSIPKMLGSLAYEFTGIPGATRTMKDIGLGGSAYMGDQFGEASRYGGSALANAILTLLTLRTATLPIAGRLLGRRFLQHQMTGIPGVSNARFMPNLARTIHNWSYGPGFATGVAKGTVNPQKYAWMGSTSRNPIFQQLFTHRPGAVTSIPGNLYNVARLGGNKMWNLGYRAKQLAVRHPIMAALAVGLPLAGIGSQRDEEREKEMRSSLAGLIPNWQKNQGPFGMPVSSAFSGLMTTLGGSDPRKGVANQLSGPSWDPWAAGR